MVLRKHPDQITDISRFEEQMTKVQRLIAEEKDRLKIGCPHHQALDRLYDALLQALRDVTGHPLAPWARLAPASYQAGFGDSSNK